MGRFYNFNISVLGAFWMTDIPGCGPESRWKSEGKGNAHLLKRMRSREAREFCGSPLILLGLGSSQSSFGSCLRDIAFLQGLEARCNLALQVKPCLLLKGEEEAERGRRERGEGKQERKGKMNKGKETQLAQSGVFFFFYYLFILLF